MVTKEEVQHNFDCLKKQAQKLFGFEVVNNYDWYKDINFIDFLRDYGKYFNINYMLNKDIVRRRLDAGITYTEFSYMLMQAMDFWWLHENKDCTLQVAGQDQWGNITAGIELIRKKTGQEAYGFTMPLLTKSDGTKFGKTNGHAIWLDINKTSAYEMYQFFINSEDSKVIDYLKFLTFLSREEIEALEEKNRTEPHLREAHKALAKAVITFIHGEEAYNTAVKIAQTLFGGNLKDLTVDELKQGIADMPRFTVTDEQPLVEVLVTTGIAKSKRESREWISGGSIMVNGEKITDPMTPISRSQAFNQEFTILRKGKKNYFVCDFQ